MNQVVDERHARPALHEEALRLPWPKLRHPIDRRGPDPAALVVPLNPEQVDVDVHSGIDPVAGIADEGTSMPEGEGLVAVLTVTAKSA